MSIERELRDPGVVAGEPLELLVINVHAPSVWMSILSIRFCDRSFLVDHLP